MHDADGAPAGAYARATLLDAAGAVDAISTEGSRSRANWGSGCTATRRRAFTAGGDARYYGSDGVRLVFVAEDARWQPLPPPLATAQLDSYATWRDAVGGELAFEDCAMRAVLEPCYVSRVRWRRRCSSRSTAPS